MTAVDWESVADPGMIAGIVDRIATRLAEAIERDASDPSNGVPLGRNHQMQEVIVGDWVQHELTGISQARLAAGQPALDAGDWSAISRRVIAEFFGYGPLQPWMSDPLVEQIDVNRHDSTWVIWSNGEKLNVGALWNTADSLVSYMKRIVTRMGTVEGRFDTAVPKYTVQGVDGSRIVMVLGGRNEHGISSHPRMSIRRFVLDRPDLAGLSDKGLFPRSMIRKLRAMMRTGFVILISGSPSAGKTTFLIALLGEVSPWERIVTVEKSLRELRLEDDPRHHDVVELFTRPANAEGRGEITILELVELCRRLNPDRVILCELIENEALEMLDVASMCRRGSLATIHARQPADVLTRLATYIARSSTQLPEYATRDLVAQSIDFVFHIDLVRNAEDDTAPPRRVLSSIVEIGDPIPGGGISTTTVFDLDATGQLVQIAPLNDTHRRQLTLAGYDPAKLFGNVDPWA